MARKLKRFMVGYDADHQTVYGKDEGGMCMYADAMTLTQARWKLKELSSGRPAKVIYKLVPVREKRK